MALTSLRPSSTDILRALHEQALDQPRLYLPIRTRPRFSPLLMLPFLLPLLPVFLLPQDWSEVSKKAWLLGTALLCMVLLGHQLWSHFLRDTRLVSPGQQPARGWAGWRLDIATGTLHQLGAGKQALQLSLQPPQAWSLAVVRREKAQQQMLGLELHHEARGAVALLTRFDIDDPQDELAMTGQMQALAEQLSRRLGLSVR